MGGPDQGEWRFVLIGFDRMRFTYLWCPRPGLTSGDTRYAPVSRISALRRFW
jgi:hypothetical protein